MNRTRMRSVVFSTLCLLCAPGSTRFPGCEGLASAAQVGSIYVTDHKIEPGGVNFEKDLKEAARPTLSKTGEGWHVFFVAYLRKAPGTEDVELVFYDTADKKHEPVNHYPLHTKATAKILMSDVEVKPEDGFKAGHKYNVLVTRLVNGREDVYARSTLELK